MSSAYATARSQAPLQLVELVLKLQAVAGECFEQLQKLGIQTLLLQLGDHAVRFVQVHLFHSYRLVAPNLAGRGGEPGFTMATGSDRRRSS